jgi:hypothetical protein
MGEKNKSYRVLVRKPVGMKPLGRPKHICRWMDNIKMVL